MRKGMTAAGLERRMQGRVCGERKAALLEKFLLALALTTRSGPAQKRATARDTFLKMLNQLLSLVIIISAISL
eukprot:scaffold210878_cov32-Tisochrysis_lutea.AAC.3